MNRIPPGAARSLVEDFASGLQQAESSNAFDTLLDEWVARGYPEMEAYRGKHIRRGEILGQTMKTMRALNGDKRAQAQAERDRLPVFEAARRLEAATAAGAIAAEGAWALPRPTAPWAAIDLGDIAGAAVRALPRAFGAAATGLTVLLTPWNSQGSYQYFSDNGDRRVLIPPGDLFGPVERLDVATGEWRRTGERARTEWKDGTPVGLIVESAETMTPSPAPVRDRGFVPPAVPDTSRESYPAIPPQTPDRETFPATPNTGDTEVFPIPEEPRAQASVFLALSDEMIRELTRPTEAHRGDDHTRRGNDIAVRKVYELLPRWFPEVDVRYRFNHYAGATLEGKNEEKLAERTIVSDATGAYSVPDVIIRDRTANRLIALNTGETLRDGQTMIAAERRQLARLRANLGAQGFAAALPKLRPGMDEAEYERRVEEALAAFLTRQFGQPPGE